MTDSQITIVDVAAAAGVSVATVSKVINDRYGVAEKTSARVRAVIDELGYTSSLVAQSLRSRRSNVIGILVSDIESFNAELLKGAARAIRGTGYDLVVFSDCGQREDQVGWERRSLARVSALTDGAILVTPSGIDVTSSAPIVAVDHNVRSYTLPTVDSDNLSGAVTATEHLIRLGHRRIGFLAGRPDLESARLREQGYRHALKAAGIPFDANLVRVGSYQPEAAREATRELLAREPRPTAIFAANDASAIETLAVARDMGLKLPDDLSVVGFDNVPESALCEPPLTTVEQPIQRMGEEAVRLLLALIDDPASPPAQVVLPTRLVERASCRALMESA
ncbi:MAG TPA: LacI family DNA-binding transcriptional regulator [Gaiellaceae bacterium]